LPPGATPKPKTVAGLVKVCALSPKGDRIAGSPPPKDLYAKDVGNLLKVVKLK
jgi:hypothetical protein